MRVLLVLGTSAGGVGRHVHDLVGGLVSAGHDIHVACPAEVGRRFAFAETGAEVTTVEFSDRPDPRTDVRAIAALRRLLPGADVIHAHGLRAGSLAVLAGQRLDVPLVVTLHNAAPEGRLLGAVYGVLERLVARGADLVLGVSRDLVERMRGLGAPGARLAVVPAPPARRASTDRYAVRAALGLGPTAQLGVLVARLAPQKQVGLLLDALEAREAWDGLDVQFVVAGDGPERGALEDRIRATSVPVTLLGTREDVPDLLAAADVVVSTARWEGQPVALQEALHAGAAIVATDAGGTGDVLGDAALLVRVGDADALGRALREVLVHGAVRDNLRSLATERASELPTSADALEAALTAYREVIDGRPKL